MPGSTATSAAARSRRSCPTAMPTTRRKPCSASTSCPAVGACRSAGRVAGSRVHAMVLGLGLTHQVEDVRQRRDQLQHTTALLNAMLDGVRRTSNSPVCLAFGGPITTPEDLEQVLAHSAI